MGKQLGAAVAIAVSPGPHDIALEIEPDDKAGHILVTGHITGRGKAAVMALYDSRDCIQVFTHTIVVLPDDPAEVIPPRHPDPLVTVGTGAHGHIAVQSVRARRSGQPVVLAGPCSGGIAGARIIQHDGSGVDNPCKANRKDQ